jgi:hypothetical protein
VPDSSTLDDLRATFTALDPQSVGLADADVAKIRLQVGAVVDEMKTAGVLPERVIIAIKDVASESGIRWTQIQLFERLATWCVARYYGEADGRVTIDASSIAAASQPFIPPGRG